MNAIFTADSFNKTRAIVHVDGDAFFASCEVMKNPCLRGKPVVVGGLRGIVVALTYEAKARGLVRGLPMHQVQKLCPEAVILPGDYDLYRAFAVRMYAIVRRYAPLVEEYSVDECFADITDTKGSHEARVHDIQRSLHAELGVTFSIGLAPTKVLAKVASKHRKPAGLVCIHPEDRDTYLAQTRVGNLWGIGPATAHALYRKGIMTALDFKNLPERLIQEEYAKPHRNIWYELNSISVYRVHEEGVAIQQSVAATRTFRPPTKEKNMVAAQFVKNIEAACHRAREKHLVGNYAYCFLKSQDFQYVRFEGALAVHTNAPQEVCHALLPLFEKFFRSSVTYRATGVTLSNIRPETLVQQDLFGGSTSTVESRALFRALDRIHLKSGVRTCLAASLRAVQTLKHRPFALPFLGEVR